MKKIYVLMIGMATGVLLTACGQSGNSQAVLEDEGAYGHDSAVESESSGAGEEMPMTLSMQDLYGREMCYRYGADTFPTDTLRSDGYEVGDIAYWPPRGSLVILYGQNGEQFERQHIGHISEGVEVFETTGDAEVTFEIAEDGRE